MNRTLALGAIGALALGALLLSTASIASADHSWGGYHWARTANPFTLQVENDLTTADWNTRLGTAVSDWSASNVLDLASVNATSPKANCPGISGKVRVCNRKYGFNGWLGVAQIWITGGTHITAGTVKVNDSYFNTSTYNTPAWRQMVMCQEIGHTFGLDHQDETFDNANLGTCMDYTNDPDGGAGGAASNDPSNEHPNKHDYDQLDLIYAHLDSTSTVGATSAGGHGRGNGNGQGELFAPNFDGVPAGAGPQDGDVFVTDLGNGTRIVTHVFWVRPGNLEP